MFFLVQQLVSSVFSELWFAPLQEGQDQKRKELLLRRVTNITAVVSQARLYAGALPMGGGGGGGGGGGKFGVWKKS